ncbi:MULTISPECIES: hypothetical protein [unclassified Rhodococcus (in: high G+C Gram-positive bacteria)]|jgi:5-methylcytosine-specific restriction protein B|uniref:hypothetical protein n=1 Tax=unclassified Rhodococcus (in: high G+C Gram-positive bacteria) TaxID=192944 RepID=UPI00077A3C91|nr:MULTISPECIES: hypothetical protein [unclassified Rhodococcus (in: high G+C Gram-positive bacteria)]KXX60992.1 hypothetical protein AZG88_35375 [Rhodococcus sp. LB1]
MNVADRSLAPVAHSLASSARDSPPSVCTSASRKVDIALRRRFAFFDLEPEYNDAWREFVIERGYDESVVDRIAVRMTKLNEVIAADPNLGKDYCIGHSYFTPGSVAASGENFSERWYLLVIQLVRQAAGR